MTGEVHWLPIAVVILAALPLVYLFIRDRIEARKYKVEESNVRCRAHENQLAHCTLVRDAKTGEPIGIRECTAQSPAVCDQACLPLFIRAEKKAAAEAAPQHA
jgi:hypothetical protein